MSAGSIRSKIASGLLKASGKVGSGAYSVYLVSETVTGGDHISIGTISESETLLVNAIFVSFDKSNLNDSTVESGDRLMVSQFDQAIELGATIRLKEAQNVYDFKVVEVNEVSPSGDVLLYKSHLRLVNGY